MKSKNSKAILFFDGGARPTNPGHAGFAAVIHMDGMAKQISRYIGIKTNNQAEYYGLLVGIRYAHFLGAKEIMIISDSKLVVNQVLGNWQVKQVDLKILCKECQVDLRKFFGDNWKIKWQRRDSNKNADTLCTAAINFGRNKNPFIPQHLKDKRPGNVIDPFESRRKASVKQSQPEKSRVRHKGLSSLLT